jgi:hypothetical protein
MNTRAARPRHALAVGASLVAILAFTLWPFGFEPYRPSPGDFVRMFRVLPTTLFDFPRNVVLFVPFGLALAALRYRSHPSSKTIPRLIGGVGCLASVGVELLQMWVPARESNVADIVGNTCGAVAGAYLYLGWRHLRSGGSIPRVAPGVWMTAAATYYALMFVSVWAVMWGARPATWEPGYPLALGSSFPHEKPWQGEAGDVILFDRALDDEEMAAVVAGALPPDALASIVSRVPAIPAARHSAARINESRQFAIAVTAQTYQRIQQDVSPIVTSSANPFVGNVAFGQDDNRLVLRWRSPLTVANDMTPEVEFPRVFATQARQRIVISFDGHHARIRTPTAHTDLFLGPEALVSAMIRGVNVWAFTPAAWQWWMFALPLPLLIFVPCGWLMASAGVCTRGRWGAAAAVVLPGLLLEIFVASYGGHNVRLDALAINVGTAWFGLWLAPVTQRLVRNLGSGGQHMYTVDVLRCTAQ